MTESLRVKDDASPPAGEPAVQLYDNAAYHGGSVAARWSTKPRRPLGQVMQEDFLLPGQLGEIEDGQVGGSARCDQTTVVKAMQLGLANCQCPYRCFERRVTTLADVPREQEGGISSGAHHLDVGTCVTVGDNGRPMSEEAGHAIGVGVGDPYSDDPWVEIIRENPVSEHVRRMAASVCNQVGKSPAEPRAMLGASHRDQTDVVQLLVPDERPWPGIPLVTR